MFSNQGYVVQFHIAKAAKVFEVVQVQLEGKTTEFKSAENLLFSSINSVSYVPTCYMRSDYEFQLTFLQKVASQVMQK